MEIQDSPSSASYQVRFAEVPDKYLDRRHEEYVQQQLNHHSQYEHQPQFSNKVVGMPTRVNYGNKAGDFLGNILHGHGVYEGNHICEHYRAKLHWCVYRLKKLMVLIVNSIHCLCEMIYLQLWN